MRRYQPFRKKRSYSAAVVIILLACLLSLASFRGLFGVRSLLVSAFYPFQFAANYVWKGVIGIPGGIVHLGSLSKENAELKAKINTFSARLSWQEGMEAENQRLRKAMGFATRAPYRVRPAEVIGKRTANYFSFIEINRGSASGVKVNMPVIVKEGLVGRVIEVSRYNAKVLLITDVMSTVAVVDRNSRDTGAAEGTGSSRLSMKYVSVGGEVKAGDQIVTSSFSSYFPAGIPVGTVSRAIKRESDLFFEIEIVPSADLSRLEEVFLVL